MPPTCQKWGYRAGFAVLGPEGWIGATTSTYTRYHMEALAQKLQQDQKDLNQSMVELQKLEIQFQESRLVKEEFDRLSDGTKIYKLIGPVLVPQDKSDADSNVSKRLEFIKNQKSQVETKIETLRSRMHETQVAFREQQIKAAVDAKTAPQSA